MIREVSNEVDSSLIYTSHLSRDSLFVTAKRQAQRGVRSQRHEYDDISPNLRALRILQHANK
jgi:hypothetical protein